MGCHVWDPDCPNAACSQFVTDHARLRNKHQMLGMGDFSPAGCCLQPAAAAPGHVQPQSPAPAPTVAPRPLPAITQELLFPNDNTAVVYLKAEPTLYRSQICLAWHHELAPEPSSWSRLYMYLKRTKTERLLSYLLQEVNQSARLRCQVLHQAFCGLSLHTYRPNSRAKA